MRNSPKPISRLLLLTAGAWLFRAAGPEIFGVWALSTNLLAAVTIQAGLSLPILPLFCGSLLVGLFWDLTTFSAVGHHVLLMGIIGTLVRSQRGWWIGASAGEQAVGSVLAGVAYFALDRFLHLLEIRLWEWPFSLNLALIAGGTVNGVVAVVFGWILELNIPTTPRTTRRRIQ